MKFAEMNEEEVRTAIGARQWYHTIDVHPRVATPGWFDTRKVATLLPWPSLSGRRCLDVGTFDGFWAFEMERRGASDVLAIDILDPERWDWPAAQHSAVVEAIGERKRNGDGFRQIANAMESRVQRRELSVYDLDPAEVGSFDFAYFGSLLLHLRDPVGALSRVRDVLSPDGRVMVVDAIDLELTVRHPYAPVARLDGVGRPWWWRPNVAGLARMVESAGLRVVEGPKRFFMPPGAGQPPRPLPSWRALRHAGIRQELIEGRFGDPHAWLLAEPI